MLMMRANSAGSKSWVSFFDDAPAFAIKLAITIPLAVASHRFLEHPIRHGSRIAGWRPWTGMC